MTTIYLNGGDGGMKINKISSIKVMKSGLNSIEDAISIMSCPKIPLSMQGLFVKFVHIDIYKVFLHFADH